MLHEVQDRLGGVRECLERRRRAAEKRDRGLAGLLERKIKEGAEQATALAEVLARSGLDKGDFADIQADRQTYKFLSLEAQALKSARDEIDRRVVELAKEVMDILVKDGDDSRQSDRWQEFDETLDAAYDTLETGVEEIKGFAREALHKITEREEAAMAAD